ncbi:hypothetical protein LINPERPRIM_LOCUS2903 [Linum perenne]
MTATTTSPPQSSPGPWPRWDTRSSTRSCRR